MKSRASHNNRFLPLCLLLFCTLSLGLQAQLVYTPRSDKARVVEPGKGQEFSRAFFTADNFHFVQFGVYPLEVNWRTILAPSGIGQIWLIQHKSTQIKGSSYPGAYYIVKAFPSPALARSYASKYKKQGVECWYNPQLHGIPFAIMGITY